LPRLPGVRAFFAGVGVGGLEGGAVGGGPAAGGGGGGPRAVPVAVVGTPAVVDADELVAVDVEHVVVLHVDALLAIGERVEPDLPAIDRALVDLVLDPIRGRLNVDAVADRPEQLLLCFLVPASRRVDRRRPE